MLLSLASLAWFRRRPLPAVLQKQFALCQARKTVHCQVNERAQAGGFSTWFVSYERQPSLL